jgi:P2 family phage contractile tail tube protein
MIYPEMHGLLSSPDSELKIQVWCNLKLYSGGKAQDIPVALDLVAWCSDGKVGTLQAADYAKPEYKLEVSYFALRVDGVELQAIDIDNHIHRVNGEDLLAQFRTYLGVI